MSADVAFAVFMIIFVIVGLVLGIWYGKPNCTSCTAPDKTSCKPFIDSEVDYALKNVSETACSSYINGKTCAKYITPASAESCTKFINQDSCSAFINKTSCTPYFPVCKTECPVCPSCSNNKTDCPVCPTKCPAQEVCPKLTCPESKTGACPVQACPLLDALTCSPFINEKTCAGKVPPSTCPTQTCPTQTCPTQTCPVCSEKIPVFKPVTTTVESKSFTLLNPPKTKAEYHLYPCQVNRPDNQTTMGKTWDTLPVCNIVTSTGVGGIELGIPKNNALYIEDDGKYKWAESGTYPSTFVKGAEIDGIANYVCRAMEQDATDPKTFYPQLGLAKATDLKNCYYSSGGKVKVDSSTFSFLDRV